MSTFTTPLQLEFIDGKFWKLLAPFIYYVGGVGGDELVLVLEGFKTDFASVPRFAWPIIGHPTGDHGKAAVVHDWLYQYPDDGLRLPHTIRRPRITRTRRRCDQIFLEAMQVLDIGWLKRTVMYSAVRLGGWVGWNNYRKADRKREGSDAREVMG